MMNDYWADREVIKREALLDKTIKQTEKEVAKLYNQMAKELALKMNEYYVDIMHGDKDLNSHRYTFNKYYELDKRILEVLVKLGKKEQVVLDKQFTKMYKLNVKLLSDVGSFPNISATNELIDAVVNAYWVGDGLNWSKRLWKNKALLEHTVKQGMFEIMAGYKNPDDVTKMVMDKTGQSYKNASRLVRTELCHILILSTIDSYKNAGLTKYRWLTARDEKVCEECTALDNQIFNIKDAEFGVNLPPLHPNDRCTILGVIE